MNKIFITTTLPYSAGVPHIGHAFEFILADALTRYLRLNGNQVSFNTGVDEHGLKVYEKAKELGLEPKEYLDETAVIWKGFCIKFDIVPNNFYRTTDELHHIKSKEFWNKCLENGDLYKKFYHGLYCTGCESFKHVKDLTDGKCPDHQKAPIVITEENWFFKISKYKSALLDWLNSNPNFLEPYSKIEELKNVIINSEDISVSRLKKNVPWGIEVPNDPEQVIYCWFEALLNYIFAANYDVDTELNFWNDKTTIVQICGPDNLRFQGSLFQTILKSANIVNTTHLLVHGTILDKFGKKMSKSVGNVVDPIEQLEKYGLDAVRYYSLAGLNTYSDSSWNEEDLISIYNSDIVNDWGNLVSRVLHLVDIKCEGLELIEEIGITDFFMNVSVHEVEVKKHWRFFRIKEALQQTNDLVKFGNKYINDTKPWASENYLEILSNLVVLIKTVNDLYRPVFPNKCEYIETAIENRKKVIPFQKITI